MLASLTAPQHTVAYDYEDNRDVMTSIENQTSGSSVEVYVYDGWTEHKSAKMVRTQFAPEGLSPRVPLGRRRSNRIASFQIQNSLLSIQNSFLWGLDLSGTFQGAGGVGGLLKEGDWYPTYDANGNIVQKLDGSGSLEMNVEYDPFGNIISGSLVGEYGFSTKPLIEGLDWYYYGFRYYDPVTGRWPNRDPLLEYSAFSHQFKLMVFQEYENFLLKYTLSGNGYNFVINNPVLYLDYLGAAPDLFGGPSRPSSPSVWDAVKQIVLGAITEVFGPCLIPGDEKDAVEKIYCLHVCADPCKNGAFKNKRGNYKKTVTYRCSGGRWNEIKSQIYESCDAAACPSGYDDKGYNPSESAP